MNKKSTGHIYEQKGTFGYRHQKDRFVIKKDSRDVGTKRRMWERKGTCGNQKATHKDINGTYMTEKGKAKGAKKYHRTMQRRGNRSTIISTR